MKKKYVASLLSLCMLLTSVNPAVLASETPVLDAVVEEGIQEQDAEENVNDETEIEEENDVILDEQVYADSDSAEEEIVIDEPEYSEDDQISEYANEEESAMVTQASDGYTQLKSAPDIEYKYDENTKTLYFKCVDGVMDADIY